MYTRGYWKVLSLAHFPKRIFWVENLACLFVWEREGDFLFLLLIPSNEWIQTIRNSECRIWCMINWFQTSRVISTLRISLHQNARFNSWMHLIHAEMLMPSYTCIFNFNVHCPNSSIWMRSQNWFLCLFLCVTICTYCKKQKKLHDYYKLNLFVKGFFFVYHSLAISVGL